MLTAVLILSGIALAQSGQLDFDPVELDVRRLVRRLDSDRLEDRDSAEAALVEMGPPVLELLPPITDETSAEVKQRLGRVRHTLERKMAEDATRESTITLEGDLPLSEVLAEFAKQSGNQIVDHRRQFGDAGDDDPTVSVKFVDTPFWQAFDGVLDQAGFTLYPYGEPRTLSVVRRNPLQVTRSTTASYAGPFRFEATHVSARADLRDPQGHSLTVGLEVAWEPRIVPLSLKQPLAEFLVTDNLGNPIALRTPDAEREVLVDPTVSLVELNVPLELPPRSVSSIGRIEGKMQALVPGRVETFRFDALADAANVENRIAGVTVVLDQMRRNNDLWEARIRIRFDEPGEALESHRTWIFDNEVYLESADGDPRPYAAYDSYLQRENEVGIAYLFSLDDDIKDYSLVYKTPTSIQSMTIDLVLEDIPLP